MDLRFCHRGSGTRWTQRIRQQHRQTENIGSREHQRPTENMPRSAKEQIHKIATMNAIHLAEAGTNLDVIPVAYCRYDIPVVYSKHAYSRPCVLLVLLPLQQIRMPKFSIPQVYLQYTQGISHPESGQWSKVDTLEVSWQGKGARARERASERARDREKGSQG